MSSIAHRAPCNGLVWIALGVAALAGWTDALPETSGEGDDPLAAFERSLESLNIPKALRAYDAMISESGPSPELLARVARADLSYCLLEGKMWARLEAARVLAAMGEEEGRAALQNGLASPQSQVRAGAARWVAEFGIEEAMPRLQAMALDSRGNAFERVEAAKALHRLGEPSIPVRVCGELSTAEKWNIRQLAVRALADFEDPAALPALQARLNDPMDAVALLAARGAARLDDPAGRERLVEALSSDVPSVRLLAGWYLGLVRDPQGFEAVERLFQQALEAYPIIRDLSFQVDAALTGLSWIDPDRARPYLEQALTLEKWRGLRLVAARRLAELGEEAALPALAAIYDESLGRSDQAPFRKRVVEAAGWMGDRPGVRDLARKAASDDHPAVELVALEVLARIGVPESLGPIRRLLGGPDLRHRALAAEYALLFGKGPADPPGSPEPVSPGPVGAAE